MIWTSDFVGMEVIIGGVKVCDCGNPSCTIAKKISISHLQEEIREGDSSKRRIFGEQFFQEYLSRFPKSPYIKKNFYQLGDVKVKELLRNMILFIFGIHSDENKKREIFITQRMIYANIIGGSFYSLRLNSFLIRELNILTYLLHYISNLRLSIQNFEDFVHESKIALQVVIACYSSLFYNGDIFQGSSNKSFIASLIRITQLDLRAIRNKIQNEMSNKKRKYAENDFEHIRKLITITIRFLARILPKSSIHSEIHQIVKWCNRKASSLKLNLHYFLRNTFCFLSVDLEDDHDNVYYYEKLVNTFCTRRKYQDKYFLEICDKIPEYFDLSVQNFLKVSKYLIKERNNEFFNMQFIPNTSREHQKFFITFSLRFRSTVECMDFIISIGDFSLLNSKLFRLNVLKRISEIIKLENSKVLLPLRELCFKYLSTLLRRLSAPSYTTFSLEIPAKDPLMIKCYDILTKSNAFKNFQIFSFKTFKKEGIQIKNFLLLMHSCALQDSQTFEAHMKNHQKDIKKIIMFSTHINSELVKKWNRKPSEFTRHPVYISFYRHLSGIIPGMLHINNEKFHKIEVDYAEKLIPQMMQLDVGENFSVFLDALLVFPVRVKVNICQTLVSMIYTSSVLRQYIKVFFYRNRDEYYFPVMKWLHDILDQYNNKSKGEKSNKSAGLDMFIISFRNCFLTLCTLVEGSEEDMQQVLGFFRNGLSAGKSIMKTLPENIKNLSKSGFFKNRRNVGVEMALSKKMGVKLECNWCREQFKKMKCCSNCKSVYYCSRECQMRDWKMGHKKHCKSIKNQ